MTMLAEKSRRARKPRKMTEAQFVEFCDEDFRAEWVNGEVIVMAPANLDHNGLNIWLMSLLYDFVDFHDLGMVYGIEVQTRLKSPPQRRNPNVSFVAKSRKSILRKTYIDGPPDLVIEIVSPDSESRDWRDKYFAYETAQVKEYWVIDSSARRVEAYTLTRTKKYAPIEEVGRKAADIDDDAMNPSAKIASRVLRGFYLRPAWLWSSPLPRLAGVAKELGLR